MVQAIIDPTSGAAPGATAVIAAAPLTSLEGLRVGLLENTKRNAADVLHVIGDALQRTDGVASLVPYTKHNFALPLPDDLLEELEASCDAVVIGIGDCGSCSASAVADGIMLESRGIPTAVICTTAFDVTAGAMAKLKGRADFPYLRTEHPIANLDAEQVVERGELLAEVVRARLLGTDEAVGA